MRHGCVLLQGLSNVVLQGVVRQYAEHMGSVRHLLADLTLPLLSLFSGHAFDAAIKQVRGGGDNGACCGWVRGVMRRER